MYKRKIFIPLIALVIIAAAACGGAEPEIVTEVSEVPVTVEVTRLVEVEKEVEVEVEVTRIVEVEVERVVTATPTATPRPTSTPRTPEAGTVGNPYALGETAGLTYQDTNEFHLTVLETVRGDEALSRIMSANQFNDPAPEGFEWLLIHVEIEYTKGDVVLELGQGVTSIVTNGRIISYLDTFTYSPCCVPNEFEVSLLAGGTADGWIALPVVVDDESPLLLLGESLYFELTE